MAGIFDYVTEPTPGHWVVHEAPGGRPVAIITTANGIGPGYWVAAYAESGRDQFALLQAPFPQTLLEACRLGWQLGRDPVEVKHVQKPHPSGAELAKYQHHDQVIRG